MRYLVTGVAGFIGSHLTEALLSAGHEVSGIDCFTDAYDPALKERNAQGLDVRRLDLATDPLDLSGLDGVFHLAGQGGARAVCVGEAERGQPLADGRSGHGRAPGERLQQRAEVEALVDRSHGASVELDGARWPEHGELVAV